MEMQDETNETIAAEITGNYYEILGVARNATSDQIGAAYKTLSLKYHPDRNPDNAEAAAHYKAVGEAYSCLIDENKRRQYDIGGTTAPSTTQNAVDVSTLGTVGRVFGAVISKFGVQVPTTVSGEFVAVSQTICRNGGLANAPNAVYPTDPRVTDSIWGIPIDGKAERQLGSYYRVAIDESTLETGFVISVKSTHKDKFKIFLFDEEGTVVGQDDAMHSRDSTCTRASLFFTPFPTYRIGEVSPPSGADKSQQGIPSMFSKLDAMISTKKQLPPGKYLFAIYGDNFLGKSSYSYLLLKGVNDPVKIGEIVSVDDTLLESRQHLDALKAEYIQTKAAYEAALAKMIQLDSRVNELLDTREHNYKAYIKASALSGAPIITAATNSVPTLPNEGEVIPATSAQSDDGFRARRLSFNALSDSLRPANITNTAKGVVDAASSGARVAASVAGNWWSTVRRPSQLAAVTVVSSIPTTKDNEEIEVRSMVPADANEATVPAPAAPQGEPVILATTGTVVAATEPVVETEASEAKEEGVDI